jgi:hypothetical protein
MLIIDDILWDNQIFGTSSILISTRKSWLHTRWKIQSSK